MSTFRLCLRTHLLSVHDGLQPVTRDRVPLWLRRGQDLGDGIWPMLSALLPRATQLKVGPFPRLHREVFPRLVPDSAPGRARLIARCVGQVNSEGDVQVVRGLGKSHMKLSSGKGLGPMGARRVAALLREYPLPLLVDLEIRCSPYTFQIFKSTTRFLLFLSAQSSQNSVFKLTFHAHHNIIGCALYDFFLPK